jgi:hypothetical protein
MKRAILLGLGLYVGYVEFSDDLVYWLPSWGAAFDSGYIWGQVVILGALAAVIFGTVVFLSRDFLDWIFE